MRFLDKSLSGFSYFSVGFLASLLTVLPQPSNSQTPELTLAAVTAIGGPASQGNVEIFTSGGQGVAGSVRVQDAELGIGYVFAVPRDFLPPRTMIAIGAPKFGTGPAIVTSSTHFSFTAVDDLVIDGDEMGFGVKQTSFALDESAFQTSTAPFTLTSEGSHTIRFFSVDVVDNVEAEKSVAVEVDDTAPAVVIQSPASGTGLEQLVGGVISIVGTAADPHFKEYRLEIATGQNAVEGFSLLVQSTAPAAGALLATLDTAGLGNGFFTLRLTAEDVVGHIAQTSVTIFVGQPGVDLLLGATPGLNHPKGVSVSESEGGERLWVADTNNDLVRGFDNAGNLLVSIGQPGFNKPAGLAASPDKSLLAVDQNNHRLVRFSTTGATLAEIGRKTPSGKHLPGSGDGEFNHPSDVTLDSGGSLYVSDTLNNRLQKFDSTGTFLAVISLPAGAFPAQPAGIVFEEGEAGAERLLVADQANNRVIRISTSGALLAEIGLGILNSPQGLFVGPSGRFFVADRNNDVVRVFDPSGNLQTSVDGLNKPEDAALDSVGRLLVADTNNGAIRRYSLEAATPTVVNVEKSTGSILAAPSTASPFLGPDPAFRWNEVYSYPNPAKHGQAPTLHVEVGLADSIDIRIYDVAGDLVHQAAINTPPQVVDDGQGLQYAYEYAWDVSGTASGVYISVVHAHKNGESDLRKVSKLAVLK